MAAIKRIMSKKLVKILLAILASGLLLIVLPLLISPEQCPDNYTQDQVNTADCIVGADIGSGLMWLLGIYVSLIAVFGLCVISIAQIPSKIGRLAIALVLIGATLLVVGYTTAPLLNSNEIYKAAKCSADDRASIEELNMEYCANPKRSPLAKIEYSNDKVLMGAGLLFGGLILSTYSILTKR